MITAEAPAVVARLWAPCPSSVGQARHLLAEQLVAWGLVRLTDAAELVVSELMTNALTHAGRPRGHVILTRFERLVCGVRIEVHDANKNKPDRQEESLEAESGRGLALVDKVTGGQWGVRDRADIGKLVWAVCADDGTSEVLP